MEDFIYCPFFNCENGWDE